MEKKLYFHFPEKFEKYFVLLQKLVFTQNIFCFTKLSANLRGLSFFLTRVKQNPKKSPKIVFFCVKRCVIFKVF